MNELDSIGTIMTGAVVAGTIEAERAVGSDGHSDEHACLNCATPLVGNFCHACGQHAHVHRTLGAFFHDLLHGVFHVEGRTWRTLPLLAWRPGELTRRYVEGERANFVSPMALFLFSVFLMFAVVSKIPVNMIASPQAQAQMRADAVANAKAVVELQHERAAAAAAGKPTAVLDKKIASEQEDARLMAQFAKDGVITGSLVRASDDVPAWLGGPFKKAAANPEFTLYKLKSGSYKWSWALIPLSVPFLWLLFPFSRRFRMYDHTVFVTYSLSFMTLLVVMLSLASTVGVPGIALMALLIPPIHMYRQLKGGYSLLTFSALWRTLALVIAATMALTFFGLAMVALGILD